MGTTVKIDGYKRTGNLHRCLSLAAEELGSVDCNPDLIRRGQDLVAIKELLEVVYNNGLHSTCKIEFVDRGLMSAEELEKFSFEPQKTGAFVTEIFILGGDFG